MKKLTLSAIAVSALFAGNTTAGDVQLVGYVPAVCEVTGLFTQLLDFGNVTTAGQTTSVGTVGIQCNDADGAIVTLSSAEGGLESDDAEDVSLAYDAVLTTASGDVTLNAPGGFATNGASASGTFGASTALASGLVGSLTFTTVDAAIWSGGYSDTLTVQIAAGN